MKFLPTYEEAAKSIKNGTATPVDKFIVTYSIPTHTRSSNSSFRRDLIEVLLFVERTTHKNASNHSTRSIAFMCMVATFGLGCVLGMIIPYVGSM